MSSHPFHLPNGFKIVSTHLGNFTIDPSINTSNVEFPIFSFLAQSNENVMAKIGIIAAVRTRSLVYFPGALPLRQCHVQILMNGKSLSKYINIKILKLSLNSLKYFGN